MTNIASKFSKTALMMAVLVGIAGAAVAPAQAGGFHFEFGKSYGYGKYYDNYFYCIDSKKQLFRLVKKYGFHPLDVVDTKGKYAYVRAKDEVYHYILKVNICSRKIVSKEEDIYK